MNCASSSYTEIADVESSQTRVPITRVSVAPMVGRTDRHFRSLLREITSTACLYTEMANAAAIVRKPALLAFAEREQPLVLQLAGNNHEELKHAARLGADYGYQALNINFGCPSKAATAGGFGACMMESPERAAAVFSVVAESVAVPVSVKCRLGVDGQDELVDFARFVETLYQAGCRSFVIHARRAWLKGLSTRANRTRPPLNYGAVFSVARGFPEADFILNGGIASPAHGIRLLAQNAGACRGVMLGRAVWNDPWCLEECLEECVEECLGETEEDRTMTESRSHRLERMIGLSEQALLQGGRMPSILRGLSRMVRGRRGAAAWRRGLATVAAGESSLACLYALLEAEQKISLEV